jgi:hypothetical protein
MAKKNRSEAVKRLATALENTKTKRIIPNPKGGTPPERYRFKPGQSGNPGGRSDRAIYARALTDRMMLSCPPRELCEDLDIDAKVTWGEAILIVLGRAAMSGDVSAARECLAALGVGGTSARTNVLVNLEQPEQRGLNFELLRHAHGISETDMREKVFPFLDALNKQKPVIDSSYFPDSEYCDGEAEPMLTEDTRQEEQ